MLIFATKFKDFVLYMSCLIIQNCYVESFGLLEVYLREAGIWLDCSFIRRYLPLMLLP